MSIVRKQFQFGEHTVTLETGAMARQADGAVLAKMGDTTVLVTAVAQKVIAEKQDFFPLTVNYQERNYAAGKIPGGYFKREGRPTEKEILTSRLIDRPLRPLFPEGFYNDVQIVATVLSVDNEIDPDIVAMLGASAAVAISGIPCAGPMGAARVGYKDGVFILNPTATELKTSKLDLVVAGTEHAVLMVESEAKELPETIMLSAVLFGHEQMQTAIKAIKELAQEAGKTRWDWQPSAVNQSLREQIVQLVGESIKAAYKIPQKEERHSKLDSIKEDLLNQLKITHPESELDEAEVSKIFSHLEEQAVRERILTERIRIDGRDTKTIRPISIVTGLLPRTHGSALFTRGETQALVAATLGGSRDAQVIDALEGEYKDRFMLHYNFPPFATGEVGMVGSPKRREIGHGRLAKRALQAVIPGEDVFPYVIRIVSEITESNGSSSMATVCGSSLALMDAGVPITSAVAGIAMGLIKEEDRFAVLTDILGDEDHFGDMDFKVAGTLNGITALQMDIKIEGVTREIMETALEQAKEARIYLLNAMNQNLNAPRTQLSEYAPRIITLKIPREKIREVIGKGGATIRGIVEETGANIDISDEGVVQIAAVDRVAGEAARNEIERLTADVEVGRIYEGTVVRLMDFGAFVTILPGRDGLVHVSQISETRVQNVSDYLKEGQKVRVKVLEIDKQGKIRLSMKEAVE